MKLVKIEDVRVGQIWRNSHWDLALIKNVNSERIELHQWNYDITSDNDYNTTPNYITENACNWKLIGKLGITHEIKDNRLVEIHEKIKDKTIYSIDDVVKYQDCEGNSFSAVINQKEVSHLYNYYVATNTLGCFVELSDNLEDQEGLEPDEYTYFPMEKIGIYGVTHEFVNDCEVKNANS